MGAPAGDVASEMLLYMNGVLATFSSRAADGFLVQRESVVGAELQTLVVVVVSIER